MEKLLTLLPERPQPAYVRYPVATLMSALSGLVLWWLYVHSGQVFYIVLIPAIYLSGLVFDRASSLVATAVGAVIPLWLFWPIVAQPSEIISLALYVLIGTAVGVLSEAMRKLLERSMAAQREKEILMRELSHRMKNNLMNIASLLMLQSRAAKSDDAVAALALAADRVNVMADVHDFLSAAGGARVSMQNYLEQLCHKVGYSTRGARPIAVRIEAENVQLLERKAVPIAIIVNELMTNCFKYAFPDDRPGTIAVRLRADERLVQLTVEDDGVGCPGDARPGVGTRLINLMVGQLGGSIERHSAGESGCRVELKFPRS